MSQIQTWAAPASAMLMAFLLHALIKWVYLRKSMPPGPLGLPWIGNQYQLPKVKPWLKFAQWSRQYGPVVSIFLGSTPVIVLGTAQAAWDLLEKRSDIYSSRPRFIVGGEILSDGKRGLMRSNDDAWRKWRKILHTGFHYRKAQTYREIQSLESNVMMHQVLSDPSGYVRHFQRYAASVVTSVTYGRRVDSVDEWIVKENMDSMSFLTSVTIPGKYIVESWPWLLKLPRYLQWFRRDAEERRQWDINFLMYLLNDVKSRMHNGTIPDCLTSQAISNMDQSGMSDLEVAYAVSSPFGAGIETTAGTLTVFILAMLHFPGAMRKAQAEIDRVVGFERMPEFDDKDSLPYVNALINETFRWRPVTALGGAPHAVTVDDEYNGMFIPEGSTVFGNFFGIMHDPAMFPSPDMFLPERFLDTTDPRIKNFELPFGFGRRICPGMHLALNSLFVNVSRLLWAFDILPTLVGGAETLPDPWNFTNGFNSWPVNFDCRIISRSPKVLACIEEDYQTAMSKLKSWQ